MASITGRGVRILALVLFASGCSEQHLPTSPVVTGDTAKIAPVFNNAFQVGVSNPTVQSNASSASIAGTVYVAFAPSELPDNVTAARIRNLTRGVADTMAHAVLNGALDPVPIAGSVGDTLEILLINPNGSFTAHAVVPVKKPPRIIRTDPPKGRTDVPLNSRIRVIFSEPINASSLGHGALMLNNSDDRNVPVDVQFEGSAPLIVDVIPTKPLEYAMSYVLEISPTIKDLAGDSLGQSVAVDFSTVSLASLSVLTVISGAGSDANGFTVSVQGTDLRTTTGRLQNGKWNEMLSAGAYQVTLGDLADHCANKDAETQTTTLNPSKIAVVTFHVACALPEPVTRAATQSLAFVSERDGDSEIYLHNEDGSSPVRITFNPGQDFDPVWSPDGKRIAFVSDRAGAGIFGLVGDIYIMNADGSNVIRRTHSGLALAPAWSPDSKSIAFETMCKESPGFQGCIQIISADSDGSTPIRVGHTTGYNGQPTWSPDGTEITFVSDWTAYDFSSDLYVTRSDGSGIRQLSNGFGFEPSQPGGQIPMRWFVRPKYSKDGILAALVLDPTFGTASTVDAVSVALMKPDGSELVRLVSAGERAHMLEWYPRPLTWSPDGSHIAFSSAKCASGTACTYDIWQVDRNGKDFARIISNGHSPTWR